MPDGDEGKERTGWADRRIERGCSGREGMGSYSRKFYKPATATQTAIRYDTIEEFNVDSKAEYTA